MVKGAVVFVGFFIYMMIALAVPSSCNPVMSEVVENIARPTRPKTFGSPDELRSYLDQLGQYLAVVSRPRFGKRKPASSGAQYDEPPYKCKPAVIRNAKDLYDLLFSSRRERAANNDDDGRRQFYAVRQDVADAGSE